MGFQPGKTETNLRNSKTQRLSRTVKFYLWYFSDSEYQRQRSDCADAQDDLYICCSLATMFGFLATRLIVSRP